MLQNIFLADTSHGVATISRNSEFLGHFRKRALFVGSLTAGLGEDGTSLTQMCVAVCVAVCCSVCHTVLQCVAVCCSVRGTVLHCDERVSYTNAHHCGTQCETHCNTLQHAAGLEEDASCPTQMLSTATHCDTHCSMLHYTAGLEEDASFLTQMCNTATHCNTHRDTRCNTLQVLQV